jgi:sirohydrochlorin ferrochelatase
MKSLLLVAHGSRREASNEEVRELARRLASRAQPAFSEVSAAFLELAEPSIPDGIVRAVDHGADQVVVLPYFLSAGRHVVTDIPEEVQKAQSARPDADIRTVPYLGSAETVLDVLLDLANRN